MRADRPRLDPHIASAPTYTPGARVEDVARRYGIARVTKLASNENPLGPSPRAVEAIRAALANVHRYPPVADDELRARLAERLGSGLSPDHFACANGGSEVLLSIAQGFLEPGDEAVICPPTFPLYEIVACRRGARAVRCGLLEPDYRYDVDAILAAVGRKTRIVFVCSPVNPTGSIMRRGELDRLAASLPGRVVLVFDECYRSFVDDDGAADPLPHVQSGRAVVAVRSLSKSHGLAGMRVGYAIARPGLAEYLRRARVPFQTGSLALAAALAALDDSEHVARTRDLVLEEREWLHAELERRGLAPVRSQANFVVFRPGFEPEAVYERLLRRGVVVRPASRFYMPHHIRVSTGTREENERFAAALDDVLAEMRAG